MPLLRDSPDDLFALCGAAAESLGIPDPAFVEKDFWVVELLRSVVRPLDLDPVNNVPCSAAVRFKGGTSLSKAFGLIKRFSEDVDILVECEGYGTGTREKRVLWPICERAGKDLGLLPEQIVKLGYKTGVTRNIDYMVPGRLDSSSIRPGVRLEMGIRGGTSPGTQLRTISSYIADYMASTGIEADFEELAAVEVDVLAPVRTLAEKLALLHDAGHLAAQGDTRPLGQAGRHFYDIHQLLESHEVITALSIPGQTMEVLAADVDAKSEEYGWSHTPRPGDGFAASLIFDPASDVRNMADQAYRNALGLVWGERPTFDEILARVARSHDLL
ncbi:MAG: nucleotidyl transferase AbiEii/AbiGii toxin family protein [Streptosporangiaceae bacterium]